MIRLLNFSKLASLAVISLLVGCATPSLQTVKPTIELETVRVAKFDQDGLDLTITLRVSNPSQTDIPLEDLQAEVFLAETLVASAEASQRSFSLKAGQAVALPLKGRVLFKPLGQALKASPLALVSGQTEVFVRGSATASYGLIPLRFERKMRLESLAR